MASITEGIADLKMAVYLFHPSLNIVAKKYSEELRHHYKRNQFATKLLGFAKEATQDLQKDEFLLQIKSLGFSDYFVDRIYNDYLELNQLSPGLIDLIKTQLRDIIANSYLALAEQKQDNPVEYIKYVQSIDLENMTELQTLHSTKIRECNFSDVSTESIEDDIKNAVPSHWDPLNRTNPYKGLINGQITVVTAAPGCFFGDTKVMTLDHSVHTLEELYESGATDIEVYCSDEAGKFYVSKAERCQLTKYITEYAEININGTLIKCTLDHEFLLENGTWVKAINLKPGDHLMKLNRGTSLHKLNFNKGKSYSDTIYETLFKDDENDFVFTHRLVKNYLDKNNEFTLVHHDSFIDGKFDSLDNRFNSIKLCKGMHDHLKYHFVKDEARKLEFLKHGLNTRFNSERVHNFNKKNWTEKREKMIEITKKNLAKGIKKVISRNSGTSSEQKKLSVLKFISNLIKAGILIKSTEITEDFYTSNRYKFIYSNKRTPSYKSAMRYFNNDTDLIFNEALKWQSVR